MASHYQFPQSSPSPFGGRDLPPDPYQRPPSTLLEKIQSYPPDVYASTPLSTQPLQPFPQPTRIPGRAYSSRPETPTQFRSSSGWSFSQAPELSTPITKIAKTFLQWKTEAQATADDYQRFGFPSPVAWVFVEGHAIPPNAIIGGVDRKGPWYIARTFYEGSLELGKAGRQYRLGASISYHGKERDIDNYEVLVEASLPTRWVYQPLPTPRPLDSPQLSLADFKLVVIIDDSDSMGGTLWSEARDALAGVAELSRLKGGEGLDMYCLNSHQYRNDLRTETEVRDFFNSLVPQGQTPIGAKLRQILNHYVPRVEDPILRSKPISILVITDGVPTDDPKPVIIEFARRLDAKNVPLRQLGIQFVQIGDDADATEALKELDDQLGPTHGIRDIVDTTPFSRTEPHLRTEVLIKIVLGAINSTLDNSTNKITPPLLY
ncbi:hypothetical protein BC827DRAFT_1263887 [Russula dissimulans]|nr:hypothetical protein BC827DRAFT_1263887 [Russula dissimulans]